MRYARGLDLNEITNPKSSLSDFKNPVKTRVWRWRDAGYTHQIDALDGYADDLVETHGGLYGTANVSAHIGVTAGYAAAAVATWGALGLGQFSVGLSPGASSGGWLPHVTYGYGYGGTYTWAHGLGPGMFTTGAAGAGPGSLITITGIPVASPTAIGACVATRPDVGNCAASCLQAYLRGWWFR